MDTAIEVLAWVLATIGVFALVFLFGCIWLDPDVPADWPRRKPAPTPPSVMETDEERAEYEYRLRRLRELEADANRRLVDLRGGGR